MGDMGVFRIHSEERGTIIQGSMMNRGFYINGSFLRHVSSSPHQFIITMQHVSLTIMELHCQLGHASLP
eukprot:Ihof_evm2s139 gene=Ihof_evmTU2s139